MQLLLNLAACGYAVGMPPPHIVYFLVDDLGFAGVGFNSPSAEPLTPHIDELASQGAVLGRHYTYQFCSPTRSSFLSGRLPIHVNQQNHPPCEIGGGVPVNMTSIATVLKGAGYATHHAGKWHGGMSAVEQLPINRGFDSSLAMLSGSADHFTNKRSCGKGNFVDMWLNDAPAHGLNGTYSEFRYVEHAISAIQAHDVSTPFFLYMAFQNVHGPTEAPDRFLDLYDDSIFQKRRNGLAQIAAVDEGISNITTALKAKDMWDNTLVIFSSDNGGPGDHENNYPLRGSKGSDFEGGVRVVAFVSGGWLPKKMRGAKIEGLMHIADWYATLASLAGVDPTDAKAADAGLPAIDSMDMSAMIMGKNNTGPRTELALSYAPNSGNRALIIGKHKIILNGKIINNGFFPGTTTPNGTDYTSETDCTKGCLFDLEADGLEHRDIAADEPELHASMSARLEEIGKTVFQSAGSSAADKNAVAVAESEYGGFWGPWEGFAPAPPAPTPPVSGGFHLVQDDGITCLRATDLAKASDLGAGACDGNAQWDVDDQGFIFNVAGKDAVFKYVRPSEHYPTCTTGRGLRLGELTGKGIGTKLNGSRLTLVTCDDKCIGADATVAPCSNAATAGWQKRDVLVV